MGMVGLEPTRLAPHDPKSCSAANVDTSPSQPKDYTIKHRWIASNGTRRKPLLNPYRRQSRHLPGYGWSVLGLAWWLSCPSSSHWSSVYSTTWPSPTVSGEWG